MGSRSPFSALRGKYEFGAEVLDVLIGGQSMLDSKVQLALRSLDEVDGYIRSYGFQLDNPIEKAEIFGNFHEALNFIRRNFLQPDNPDGLRLEIPKKILELLDVRELLLMASLHQAGQMSDTQGLYLRNWACALLKVMHTIAHTDKDLRTSYFTDIQQQILDRFYRVLHRDPENRLYLGERDDDPLRVDLVEFLPKPKKSRESTILKLLHKPENVAEDIFDRVGIRFITETKFGALRVVKYLRDKNIFMPPNIKPSRSRNTLVDLEFFKNKFSEVWPRAERGELDEAALVSTLEAAVQYASIGLDNPHSSSHYRAMQFTCRQLIKLRNPLYTDLKGLKTLVKSKDDVDSEILKVVDKIDLKYLQREVRFFYPFEIQVMDRESAEENEKGRSSHSEYKKAQVQTALKRVMGSLMDAVR
ncbi:TIGR04552 family protein [Bdellovibrionota bacterium FG-2]